MFSTVGVYLIPQEMVVNKPVRRSYSKRHTNKRRLHGMSPSSVRYPWLRLARSIAQHLQRISSMDQVVDNESEDWMPADTLMVKESANEVVVQSTEDAPLPTAEEILAERVDPQSEEISLSTDYDVEFDFDDLVI